MNRRSFLRWIGLGSMAGGATSLAAAVPALATDRMRPRRKLLMTTLAGYQYYEADRLISALRVGDQLRLRANPANRYDPRAVEVWWNADMLGHIPRTDNASVALLLSDQVPVLATVRHVDPAASIWQRIGIDVWLD